MDFVCDRVSGEEFQERIRLLKEAAPEVIALLDKQVDAIVEEFDRFAVLLEQAKRRCSTRRAEDSFKTRD